MKWVSLCAQPYLTLCNPMNYSPLGSSVYGISQARILEWAAISYSKGSSQPRDWTRASYIGRWILYHWASWEALYCLRWGGNLDTHYLAQCLANEMCLHWCGSLPTGSYPLPFIWLILLLSVKQSWEFYIFLCVSHSVTSNSATLWTVAHQTALSMGFSRQEY